MAKNHQEFTDSHLRPAADADSANLALVADMATRAPSSFLWYLAAKAGQSTHEIGRTTIRNDPDRKLYEQSEFLEQARQDLPFQHHSKAAVTFSSPKSCARQNDMTLSLPITILPSRYAVNGFVTGQDHLAGQNDHGVSVAVRWRASLMDGVAL